MLNFEGKVVLVTGGGKGIGKEICFSFSRKKAGICVADIDYESAQKTADEIIKNGGKAIACSTDITNTNQLRGTVRETIEKLGGLDFLICSAGITFSKDFLSLTKQDWEKTIKINLKGSFLTIKAVVPHFVEQKRGKIVVISSASSITGTGGGAHYAASKGGQNGLVKALSRELGPKGININAIAPRVIETEMLDNLYPPGPIREELIKKIPVRRIGYPKDVADLAIFLCSESGDYINGQILLVDGGRTINVLG